MRPRIVDDERVAAGLIPRHDAEIVDPIAVDLDSRTARRHFRACRRRRPWSRWPSGLEKPKPRSPAYSYQDEPMPTAVPSSVASSATHQVIFIQSLLRRRVTLSYPTRETLEAAKRQGHVSSKMALLSSTRARRRSGLSQSDPQYFTDSDRRRRDTADFGSPDRSRAGSASAPPENGGSLPRRSPHDR